MLDAKMNPTTMATMMAGTDKFPQNATRTAASPIKKMVSENKYTPLREVFFPFGALPFIAELREAPIPSSRLPFLLRIAHPS